MDGFLLTAHFPFSQPNCLIRKKERKTDKAILRVEICNYIKANSDSIWKSYKSKG